MLISNIEDEYNVIQHKIGNNESLLSSMHYLIYNNGNSHSCNDCLIDINKCFQEYENETVALFTLIKSFFDKAIHLIEDNKSLMCDLVQLKEEWSYLSERVNELSEQNDIMGSQINYLKKQSVEKDNYIFELKTKIADIQSQSQSQGYGQGQLDKSSVMNLSYKTYDEITLPQRVMNQMSEEEKSTKRINSSMNLNLNLSNITDMNDDRPKHKYETHLNYGYDYKDQDLDSSLKKMDQKSPERINSETEENKGSIPYKGTINKRVHDVIMNLYKNDTTVNHLQNAFGNDIIYKMSSGNIDSSLLDKVEVIVNKKNKEVKQKEAHLKEEVEKSIINTKDKSRGWERLKGYMKIKHK